MKKFKHIITCILAIVISVCLLSTSVLAAWQNDLGYWYVNSGYAQMVVGGLLNVIGTAAGSAAGSLVLPGGGTISGTFIGQSLANCATLGIYKLADYYAQGYTDDDFLGSEAAAIGGMSRSDVLASHSVTGFSASKCSYTGQSPFDACHGLVMLSSDKFFDCLYSLGINERCMILQANDNYFTGLYFDSAGKLSLGAFTNPFGTVNASYFGVYNLSDLDRVLYAPLFGMHNNKGDYIDLSVFYDKSYAEASSDFMYSSVYAINWSKGSARSDRFYPYVFYKDSSSTTWVSSLTNYLSFFASPSWSYLSSGTSYGTIYGNYPVAGSVTWDNSRIVVAAPEAEPETRPSSLMQAIHNYNVDNSYTDNSTTVNYFLAPKDQTPTSDNVVSPAIFDEETWVFTEPATGAQYQSTGWTYDYTTRTYDIDLEAGTFTLDGTDVTRIVSQYGNELATITYYDASGNALATDEYNYVMMAASECALNGHTYNANITKEPTCNAAGERTYTCSACGNQYVEEIAKTDHVYADHTITKEPTCTVGGISSKTCSTCGDQIIEKLDPLGHDFIAKEITETKYDLPPGTSCPSCSGTNYTFSRQGVIYTLLCSDCNTEWTAEADVTYGSTTYVCSNCGESKVEGDATEETQETWFTKFIYKFKWLSSIGQIYRQLVADITSDAETAAAIADGTVMLDEVTSGHAELGGGSAGSEGSGRQYTAPELAISFGNSDHYGVDWDAIKPLNLSWYAPHKETVDGIVSGILWLGFLFLLIKRAPSIIQGGEMITEDRVKIDRWNNGIRSYRR